MLSGVAFLGAIEIGIIYGIVAFGVFFSFRLLSFPDLTVESTFPLGGAIVGAAVLAGVDPWLAIILAFLGGGIAGLITAFLSVRLGILHLLAGILTMIAGYSINIRIMGHRPNLSLLGQDSLFTPMAELTGLSEVIIKPLLLSALCLALLLIAGRFLKSEIGLSLRATGQNARMVKAQGVNPSIHIALGLTLSNAMVALGGALFTQANGFADVSSGIGTIVFGLAAVILGEALLPSRKIYLMLLACLLGSVIYRLFVAIALGSNLFGLKASDLNLVTALLVTLALIAPKFRQRL